jgi:hypothetical protein
LEAIKANAKEIKRIEQIIEYCIYQALTGLQNTPCSGNHWEVESEIFLQLRVETIFSVPRQQSRVFSKNFLRQLPDGTTQASGWRVN